MVMLWVAGLLYHRAQQQASSKGHLHRVLLRPAHNFLPGLLGSSAGDSVDLDPKARSIIDKACTAFWIFRGSVDERQLQMRAVLPPLSLTISIKDSIIRSANSSLTKDNVAGFFMWWILASLVSKLRAPRQIRMLFLNTVQGGIWWILGTIFLKVWATLGSLFKISVTSYLDRLGRLSWSRNFGCGVQTARRIDLHDGGTG